MSPEIMKPWRYQEANPEDLGHLALLAGSRAIVLIVLAPFCLAIKTKYVGVPAISGKSNDTHAE